MQISYLTIELKQSYFNTYNFNGNINFTGIDVVLNDQL